MADSLEKQLLRATKDPSSYTKFINARRGKGTGSVTRSILDSNNNNNNSDSSKSLKAIQDLLKSQIANSRVPIQFVKNDFQREKINHTDIEKRIKDNNSITKEINRVMEDFRATLFNITNIREFDAKLNALMQSDIQELLESQRELTVAQTKDEFSGSSIRRISYIQEKMYKTMEKIQHHFVVQQDIKKKEQKQNIIINVNQGASGFGSNGIIPEMPNIDDGRSFFGPLFEFLGIRNIAKTAGKVAGAVVAGRAVSAAAQSTVKANTARVSRNAAKFRLFLKKHPFLKWGWKVKGVGALITTVIGVGAYGMYQLDDTEYDSLLNSMNNSLSNFSKLLRETFMGNTGNSMKDFYESSYYMNGNEGVISGKSSYYGLNENRAVEALSARGAKLAGSWMGIGASYTAAGARYAGGMAKYLGGTAWDKTGGKIASKISYMRDLRRMNQELKRLQNRALTALSDSIENFDNASGAKSAKLANTLSTRTETLRNRRISLKDIPPRARPKFNTNKVLRKATSKIPVLGTVAGACFAVSDLINYFSVDIDKQIKAALDTLNNDKRKFKNEAVFREISSKIIENMKYARKWWLATITESITMSAINIGVGAGTAGLGLVVSVVATTIVDALFALVRDWSLGFDFDLIDFDNPYTFINQDELAEVTSVSFLVTGSGISVQDLKKEYRNSNESRAATVSEGVNATIIRARNQIYTKLKFDSNIKIDVEHWWNPKHNQSTIQWGAVALILSTFANGNNYRRENYKDRLVHSGLDSTTLEEYGDLVTEKTSGYVSLFYPKTDEFNILYFTLPQKKGLTAVLKGNNNEVITKVINALKFLYSVATIFHNNLNLTLKKQLEIYIKEEKNTKYSYLIGGVLNVYLKPLCIEFVRVFNQLNSITAVEDTGIDYRKNKKEAENILNNGYLDSVNKLCQDKNGLSTIIKNYCIIYLLYSDINKNDNNLKDKLNGLETGHLATLVSVLRSPKDWEDIIEYYAKNKDNLIKSIEDESLVYKNISSNLNISNESSFANKITEGVDISNIFTNNTTIAGFNYNVSSAKLGDYDIFGKFGYLDETYNNSTDEDQKLKLAGYITQKALGTNDNASIAIAKLVMAWLQLKDGDGALNHLKTLKNVKDNYFNSFSDMMKYEGNQKVISELAGEIDETIDLETLRKYFSRLVYPTVQKGEFSVYDIKGNLVNIRNSLSGDGLGKGGKNGINDSYFGIKNVPVTPTVAPPPISPTSGSDVTVGGETNTSAVKASNGPVTFDLNSVQNAELKFNSVTGRYYCDDPWVQYVLNKESKGDPNAYNESGATGLFQFVKSTWQDNGIMGGTPYSSFEYAKDPQLNFLAFKKLVARNARIYSQNGTPLTPFTMYMAHQQGASGFAYINGIAKGTKVRGMKDYDKIMRNMMNNVPGSVKAKMVGMSDMQKAQMFLSHWASTVDLSGNQKFQTVVVPYKPNEPSETDIQNNEIMNEDGVADALFINDITNDMLFGVPMMSL